MPSVNWGIHKGENLALKLQVLVGNMCRFKIMKEIFSYLASCGVFNCVYVAVRTDVSLTKCNSVMVIRVDFKEVDV